LKIINQTLLENFQSNLAEKISIKVWLRKVKLILSSHNPGVTTKQPIRQPVFNQRSLEKFQSKSAEKISIKVCLHKVKLILSSNDPGFTTEQPIRQPIFNQRSPAFFQSGSAENFSIKAWLKNEIQSLIDPDQNFNRDRDRDCNFPGRIWSKPGSPDPGPGCAPFAPEVTPFLQNRPGPNPPLFWQQIL
jgi:hypothetical protein